MNDHGGMAGGRTFNRVTNLVYRGLVLELLLVITCLPTIAAWVLLARSASNAPLFVLAALPVAPALTAGLGAIGRWEVDGETALPRSFWHCYGRDLTDVLKWWLPAVGIGGVIAFNLAHVELVPGSGVVVPILVAVGVLMAPLCMGLIVVTSVFSFRMLDAVRVTLAMLFSDRRFLGGVLLLLVLGVALVYLSSEAVLLLFATPLLLILHALSRTATETIKERFTQHD